MTGVHALDAFLDDGNIWLKAVMKRLDTQDGAAALAALRATLHALRDRLPPESAVHLGAQLPTLIRGVFFENWHMAGTPTKERHLGAFLEHVKAAIPESVGVDPDSAARAVLAVISERVDAGEVSKVLGMLPLALRGLWPQRMQDAAVEK